MRTMPVHQRRVSQPRVLRQAFPSCHHRPHSMRGFPVPAACRTRQRVGGQTDGRSEDVPPCQLRHHAAQTAGCVVLRVGELPTPHLQGSRHTAAATRTTHRGGQTEKRRRTARTLQRVEGSTMYLIEGWGLNAVEGVNWAVKMKICTILA